jgi:phosphoribosylaminoimidazole-succinocarboxamide synthase
MRGENMNKIISGKVRDVYEISDDRLVIVTTDRISCYDVILSKPVKDKGKILHAVSLFWFDFTKDIVPNHIISSDLKDMPEFFQKSEFEGRAVMVKKLKIIPFECIVRGYVFGSMWNAYTKGEEFCGIKIEGDYKMAEKLYAPIFTPSTKAPIGQHDESVPYDAVAAELGTELAGKVRDISVSLYEKCYKYAYDKGIIIADTKFEFGLDPDGVIYLADELFTPDSSRFWNLADYEVGVSPRSFDKQFVRDWLTNNKVGGEMQFDNVPDEVLQKTSEIYAQCLDRLCGSA